MKTIELVKVKEPVVVNGKTQEVEIATLDLLETAINNPVKGGYSAADMLVRIKLLDLVKTARTNLVLPGFEATISFEDADFAQLKNMVKETKWSILSKTILEFVQNIEKL